MPVKKLIDTVKVRMYRHGFGDCFLLSFYMKKERCFTILIDCGIKYNSQKENFPIEEVIGDLKDNLMGTSRGKPKIDVLVATHEHWDHIAYFHPDRFDKKDWFSEFQIGQAWLAWTENPRDKEAETINSRLREGAAALGLAAAKIHEAKLDELDQTEDLYYGSQLADARKSFTNSLNDVMGFYGTSLKETSESGIKYKVDGKISFMTQEAMENVIKLGQDGDGVKYFLPGTTVNVKELPGVSIHVLGPPKNSQINKSNPSRGRNHETYLSIDKFGMTSFVDGLLAMGVGEDGQPMVDAARPFGDDIGIDNTMAESNRYFVKIYFAETEGYRKIEHNWLDIAGQFALQLDGAINNTSLVLAIELEESGKVMLFPGDAQVGSWLSWHDYEWNVKDGDKTVTRSAEDILNNTILYKVSHHGSHNATIKEKGLEMMTHPELVSMIPEKEDSYNGILYQPLMERLDELCKGRVIVSADKNHPPEDLKKKRPDKLSAGEWKSFKKNLEVHDLYIEYTIHS